MKKTIALWDVTLLLQDTRQRRFPLQAVRPAFMEAINHGRSDAGTAEMARSDLLSALLKEHLIT